MEQYVFWFNDSRAPQFQDERVCRLIFDDFWERLERSSVLETNYSPIQRKEKIESLKMSFDSIAWLPRYASSILIRRLDSSTVALGLVGLDNWEQIIHASASGRESTAEPNICKPFYVDLGQTSDDVEKIISSVRSKLLQSEENCRAHLRHQSNADNGNQKTPSFVWSVTCQVMSPTGEDTKCRIQGGTTDVGLHTGCIRRNTSFPLVASTLATIFRQREEPNDEMFLKCLSCYFLSFLSDFVYQIESFDQGKVDRGVVMIRTIEKHLSHVDDEEFVDAIVSQVARCHEHLMDLRPGSLAHLYTEPELFDNINDILVEMRNPNFPEIPASLPAGVTGDKLAQARALARQNLRWSKVSSFGAIGKTQDAFIDLAWLNTYFWELSEGLSSSLSYGEDTDAVWSKLEHHRKQSLHLYEATLNTAKLMSVTVRSNEMLATWICYCWAHHEAELQHPIFEGYGSALKATDLEHLVLDHPQAVAAAKLVKKFLLAHNQPCRPFSVSAHTMEFALAFGKQSRQLRKIHENELRVFVKKRDERWEMITKIQRTLCKLDAELWTEQRHLSSSQSRLETSAREDFEWKTYGRYNPVKEYLPRYYEIQSERDTHQREVCRLAAEIARQERLKPPNLTAGLPLSEHLSVQWLFFLFMPDEFVFLAKVAQKAAGKLYDSAPTDEAPKQDLHAWYLGNAKAPARNAWESERLTLFLGTNSVMPSINTPDVRKFSSETGVISPDQFVPLAAWKSTNPFNAPPPSVQKVTRFTEMLPVCHQRSFMQKYIRLGNHPCEHENESIAQQENKPRWLLHEHYLAFAGFREGPYSQFRSLIESIADNLLPFDHECVHVLVRQAVFQLGKEDWSTDASLGGHWKGLTLLATEMIRQEALLRHSPKHAESLVVFANVCSYYGQIDSRFYDLAFRFAKVARDLGDAVQCQLDSPKEELSKQAMLYECAIRCLSRVGHLTDGSAILLIELIVLFRNKRTLSQVHTKSSSKQAAASDEAVLDVVSPTFKYLIELVEGQREILTSCLRLVRDLVPTTMTWTPVSFNSWATGCYEAVWNEQLFSINLLNGVVLVDGVPPTVLPESIVDDSYCKRVFQRVQFEVEVLGIGQFRTTRLVSDRYLYEFSVDSKETVQIVELDMKHSNVLAGNGISSQDVSVPSRKLHLLRHFELDIDLPPIILSQHSLWYLNEEEAMILLRDKPYSSRMTRFVMSPLATLIVNGTDAVDQLAHIWKTSHRLLMGTSCLTNSLEAFEYARFIHFSINSDATVVTLSLPRYKLSFRMTRKGRNLVSEEFRGFSVLPPTRLSDTLYNFDQFITMRHADGTENVIVPNGRVQLGGRILVDERGHDALGYEIFSIHPRLQHLVAKSSLGSLHLAAIYAACASLLPDRRHSKTPTYIATEAVRQAWTNAPFSSAELAKLSEVSSLSCFDATLQIVCFWVYKNSRATEFLHESNKNGCSNQTSPTVTLEQMATAEYRSNPYLHRLLDEEENSLFGTFQPRFECVPMSATRVDGFVGSIETKLAAFAVSLKKGKRESQDFFLSRPQGAVGIVVALYDDLEASFVLHRSLPQRLNVKGLDTAVVEGLTRVVAKARCELQSQIMNLVGDGNKSPKHFLSLYSGKELQVSVVDLLKFVAHGNHIFQFVDNDAIAREVVNKSVDWALLCVLEDKLERIRRLVLEHGSEIELVRELQCTRTWPPTKHPSWLVFEVEQQIQIRPEQYAVVHQLLSTRGSVIQLDMGMGKTRVLVPMLVLELISKQDLCRVNVLPEILNEALRYYKDVLSASVLRVRLFSLPFERSVPFDELSVSLLNDQMSLARTHRGCFVMTPQHRNSLLLRQHEISCFVEGFGSSVVDILDESDAILSHDFQLVYAVGNQAVLPDAERRWTVLHCLLRIFVRNTKIREMLHSDWIHRGSDALGAYPKLRLLGEFWSAGSPDLLNQCICQAMLQDPPDELRWLHQVSEDNMGDLLEAMTLPQFDRFNDLVTASTLIRQNFADVLAIRGFLVFGILFHGLGSRFGVHYGLNPDLKTRMAVPFSACDTPKYRAQYCHPDVELVFSALSYLHVGLTEEQLLDTLRSLQTRGVEARARIFASWIATIREDVPPEDIEKFDVYEKVDLDNSRQFRLMHQYLSQCMEVITYWTGTFVYPTDTMKFPQRRVTNAWNVCDSGGAIGFSGTDDNKQLLPSQYIRQIPQALDELRATNGRRLELVIQQTKRIVKLDGRKNELWEEVILQCVELKVQALIDVSGLMAGSTNREVATKLAAKVSGAARGVLFMDKSMGVGGDWAVFEIEYNRVVPRTNSSLLETDCFVFFDESRCRGSDVKLNNDAVALVTLEPKLTKDKFLQGCARMRKLEEGQGLILAGTKEVVPNSSTATATAILDRIMRHTADETQRGLVSFYQRGRDYDVFPDPIGGALSLQAMYKKARPEERDFISFLDDSYDASLSQNTKQLIGHCKEHGEGVSIAMHNLAEECEQEAQEEVEEEEQEEVEISLHKPKAQIDWEYDHAFTNPTPLFEGVFVPLGSVIRRTLHEDGRIDQLADIQWSDKIYCTNNFWHTLESSSENLAMYVRRINSLLLLDDGRAVLLSAYELNKLLPIWWKHNSSKVPKQKKAVLKHLFLSESGEGFGFDDAVIPDDVLSFLKFFRGSVNYSDPQKRVLAKSFLDLSNPRDICWRVLSMRGRLHHFECSDLETISFGFTK